MRLIADSSNKTMTISEAVNAWHSHHRLVLAYKYEGIYYTLHLNVNKELHYFFVPIAGNRNRCYSCYTSKTQLINMLNDKACLGFVFYLFDSVEELSQKAKEMINNG
ncbi:hypothetical protein CCP3SC5AM1_2890002 [Gammaproteobacteria bacterium]